MRSSQSRKKSANEGRLLTYDCSQYYGADGITRRDPARASLEGMAKTKEKTIYDMPDELWVRIFDYLRSELETLVAVFDVCVDWRRILTDTTSKFISGPATIGETEQKTRIEQFDLMLSCQRQLARIGLQCPSKGGTLENQKKLKKQIDEYIKVHKNLGVRQGNTFADTSFRCCGKQNMTRSRATEIFSVYTGIGLFYSLGIALIYYYACRNKAARIATLTIGIFCGFCLVIRGAKEHWSDRTNHDPRLDQLTRFEQALRITTTTSRGKEEELCEEDREGLLALIP